MRLWSLRDLRWQVSNAVWAPGAWVEMAIDDWRTKHLVRPKDYRLALLARLELLEGWRICDLPWHLRLAHKVVGPSLWLSELIYSSMAEDERAKLDYWKQETPRG